MFKTVPKIVAVACIAAAGVAQAGTITYTEDFEGTFPAWESGWLGANTNVVNYYCPSGGCNNRGNNPDGLWARVGSGVMDIPISFLGGFGDNITSLDIDVAGFASVDLRAWDKHGALIYSQAVALTFGAFTDPGIYSHYTINSTNGISMFGFFRTASTQASGNTSIDNVVVNIDVVDPGVVPEPSTFALMALGLAAMGAVSRRRRA